MPPPFGHPPLTTTRGARNHCLILFLLISATFVAFLLISSLLNTTSPPQNLTFSSLRLSCLRQLIANPSLYPPTFSILVSKPKVDVVYMYATTYLALVFLNLTLLNSQLSGFGYPVILLLNISVLFTYLLILLTIQNSLTILPLRWNTFYPFLPSQKSLF